jgi:cytoskeletal protein CcmA (bactofilin family)
MTLFGARRDTGNSVRELAKKNALTSMIGEGMDIHGTITVRDSLMVFGRVFGDIKVTGPTSALMLREGSGVKGDINAPIVLVRGRVIGNIVGQTVRLFPEAHVTGRIHAEKLIVDDGATIETDSLRSNLTTPWSATADPLANMPNATTNDSSNSGTNAAQTNPMGVSPQHYNGVAGEVR